MAIEIFHKLFFSELANDENKFNIDEVIKNINQKLIRRHPHVFGDSEIKDVDGILKQWDEIKKEIKENVEARQCFINEIKQDEIGLDIGYNTTKLFKTYLEKSKTIIWNGPLGLYEIKPFDEGTIRICEILKNIDAKKIVGGGDTASAIINLGYKDVFDHISTGGGASLELLEGKKLPGVEVINEKKCN